MKGDDIKRIMTTILLVDRCFLTYLLLIRLSSEKLPAGKARIILNLPRAYAVTSDEQELARLDAQHAGFKAAQGGKNYWAPFAEALPNEGADKMCLDIGVGTGIWAIEMAKEFPRAEWIGTDLAPVQKDYDIPDNLHFVQEDATKGFGYPDAHFDVIHARMLIAGIRNWKALINEVVRLLKPGALVVFVECVVPWRLMGVPEEEQRKVAPGFVKFGEYLTAGCEGRGYDNDAATKHIAKYLRENGAMGEVQQAPIALPLWPWSDDPVLKKCGQVMLADSKEVPDATRHLIIDGCQIKPSLFEEIKQGYMEDLERPGCHSALLACHNWAFKNKA
ncbi:hypothetical protein P7C73_g4386, partial [Tremellales sp. Uapishka_1]